LCSAKIAWDLSFGNSIGLMKYSKSN